MIHPDTQLTVIDDVTGVGLVATKAIPMGTITWCRDELDIVLSARETRNLSRDLRNSFLKYAYRTDRGDYILNWDNGRYQNHSCQPTSCLLPSVDCEIALRDIAAGEQVSSDYATYNLTDGFACSCGAQKCRSTILPDDKQARMEELAPAVEAALEQFDKVDQPLKFIAEYFPSPNADARRPNAGWALTRAWYGLMNSQRKQSSE